MNDPQNHLVHHPGEGEHLRIGGDRIRVLADSRCTAGACVVFEVLTEPGAGPPMHRHGREDEFFFIIDGTVKFSLDGQELTLGPGSFVRAPRGSVHTFRNVGATPSRMLVTCTPGGLEDPFRAADRLTREGHVNPHALAGAFQGFGVTLHGPPLGP